MKKPKLGSGGRFKILENKLAARGASNPAGLAAYIGAKKYGQKKMSSMAVAGKNRKDKADKAFSKTLKPFQKKK